MPMSVARTMGQIRGGGRVVSHGSWRPSRAPVFHCWQSSTPLTGRSSSSGRMMSSGMAISACTQKGGLIGHLDAEDGADADDADEQHDEPGRAIAAIGEFEGQAAARQHLAPR